MSVLLLFIAQANAQRLNRGEKKTYRNLETHINYLASERLEGRATGSDGERLSAVYIAEMFEKQGLKPMGDNGYFQTFKITTLRMADGTSRLEVNGAKQSLFKSFYPLSYSSNDGSYSGEAVYAGFGIASEELGRNDYDSLGADVAGKAVVINLGSPDGIHPHSKFSAWHGIQIRVDEAVKRGASAVIFVKYTDGVEPPDGNLLTKIKPSGVPVAYLQVSGDLPAEWNIDLKVKILVDEDEGHNVIGFLDNGAKTTVVIGAHHDHLGHGEHGGSLAEDPSGIHYGADDNASGTAALFELARCLKKERGTKSNNYLFIAFSGEEMGLLGSKYFVDNPTIDLSTVNYMLNMDMIGKLDSTERTLVINGVGTSPAWNAAIGAIDTGSARIKKIKTTESGFGASDHTSFYLANIPAVHFFTGQHEHYHKPSDVPGILYLKGEIMVINAMIAVIKELDDDGKLAFTKTKDIATKRASAFSVTLGIMPDYIYDGEGLRVDGVRDGKPGKEAGLQKGDVIISMHGRSVKGISDYMELLGELKPGEATTLQVRRGEEILTLKVQF